MLKNSLLEALRAELLDRNDPVFKYFSRSFTRCCNSANSSMVGETFPKTSALTEMAEIFLDLSRRLFLPPLSLGVALISLPGGVVRADQVTAGHSIVLSASADGTPPFTYQWQKDGASIRGAAEAKHSLNSVRSDDSGKYTVIVSNSMGSTTSAAVTLAVVPREAESNVTVSVTPAAEPTPVPAQQSVQVATVGHDVSLSSGFSNSGQWQVSTNGGSTWLNIANGSNYSGATTGTLLVSSVSAGLNDNRYRFVAPGLPSNVVTLSVGAAIFPFPVGIAADSSGNLYVTDSSTDTVQKVSSTGIVSLVAGASGQIGITDGSSLNARFNDPSGLSSSADGTLIVSDSANGTIRRISTGGAVSTISGSTINRGNVDGGASAATFSSPLGVAQDSSGNLYIADAINHTIRKVTASGMVSTLAGNAGVAGSADGTGSAARFNQPIGVAVDSFGNVYVADTVNNTVRKVSAGGVVTTVAGLGGVNGFQDGFGTTVLFNNPNGLAVDAAGNVYVADTGNSCIRKIALNGVVSTFAGLPGIAGLKDGADSNAWFNQPRALVVGTGGFLYVADTGNAAIRKISFDGKVSTISLSMVTVPPVALVTTSTESASNAGAPVSAIQSGSSGGGGGGGGSMSVWFTFAFLFITAFRLCVSGKGRQPLS